MMKRNFHFPTLLPTALLLCLSLYVCSLCVRADGIRARPSVSGVLHVEGGSLADGNGNTVVLAGVSTHGLTYYPEFIDARLFAQISEEWNCNLVRLAMYSDIYCESEKSAKYSYTLMKKGVEAAVAADMYVIADWHILKDGNPNENHSEALDFFTKISAEYGNLPNIIYEICNEPNGGTTWSDIRVYAQDIIAAVAANDPDAVFIVGTPEYDTDLASAWEHPLSDYPNVLYSYHFYAASHGDEARAELEKYLDLGMPVFVSECGIVEADGNGEIDFDSAEKWFSLLDSHCVGYTVWSLSDKNESSAMIRMTAKDFRNLSQDDLTPCGQYVRRLLSGAELSDIPSEIDFSVSFAERWQSERILPYGIFAAVSASAIILCVTVYAFSVGKERTYDGLLRRTGNTKAERNTRVGSVGQRKRRRLRMGKAALMLSLFTTVIYLCWRAAFSLPTEYGILPTVISLLLLAVELLGFAESCVHYSGMIRLRDYPLPKIADDKYPHVDVFVATYNEPTEVLRKTLIGCTKMKYPDKNKVHIYLCDDKRRAEMHALAAELGVNYFDRPDNSGAKAGNLNAAMARTTSPYVVTFDADMIPREEFLTKTIPYFVDAEKRNASLPENERLPLGIIQTPQAFYNPDVFQHNLYAEKRIPNEQDFFYRTVEAAKTSSNSVIYGGSNTVILRRAIEDIGGFYTGSITEDFATGLLIEEKGYISLGLSEPLASGLAPATFREHIVQRTRWGRGVILTAKKLGILRKKNLTFAQKASYLSSVIYWYSPLKNLLYILSPLIFAAFGIPVLVCSWREVLLYWLPMFVFQSLTLRLISGGSISTKRSGIEETAVMPFLLLPVIKETLGISLSVFKVTEKKANAVRRQRDSKALAPFLVLILISLFGIVRVCVLFAETHDVGLAAVLFWLVRNLYFLSMCLFLIDGRDGNGENVMVVDAEPITLTCGSEIHCGVTTLMTEHSVNVFADDADNIRLGEHVGVILNDIPLEGTVVSVRKSQNPSVPPVYTVEILDFSGSEDEYIHFLYNRIPTLPSSLDRDLGFMTDLWVNLIRHLGAQTKY